MLVLSQRVFCQMDSDERSVQLIKIGVINDSSRLSGGLGVLSIPPNSHCSSVCWGRNLAHMHWVHLGLKVLWQHTAGQERSRNWAPPDLGPSSPFLDHPIHPLNPQSPFPGDTHLHPCVASSLPWDLQSSPPGPQCSLPTFLHLFTASGLGFISCSHLGNYCRMYQNHFCRTHYHPLMTVLFQLAVRALK